MKRPAMGEQGFTIIELIITLAIFSILIMIAVPSYRGVIANARVSTGASQFVEALSLARAEAVRRGVSVAVCASNSTQTGCGTSSNWGSNGWLVFVDSNADGTLANLTDRLAIIPPLDPGVNFSAPSAAIVYSASGYPLTGTGTYTINSPNCIGQNGRQISLISTGRPAVSYIACA